MTGEELRDRFFQLYAHKEDDPAYLAQVDATVVRDLPRVDGLTLAWHPTATHKALRFVEESKLDPETRSKCARPAAPNLCAVFADPRELSFRTYENIVPLVLGDLDLAVEEPERLAEGAWRFKLRASKETYEALLGLDALGLYVPPLNASSRGGERFIFHSAELAEALTAALKTTLKSKKTKSALQDGMKKGFSHINPVFRCNAFEPDDDAFHRHFDTPYFDEARGHVSRFTLLLYLTGGTAKGGALQLGDVKLETIPPMTCVVFDQRIEHEGSPFDDGRKVFLRTELVFEERSFPERDPRIGELFSKACYLTGESVFQPELTRWADAYFNRVAAAHWEGLRERQEREPFLKKEFRGVSFVTNGFDFWFSKHLSLEECAALTLLDYFNCVVGGTGFRAQCRAETVFPREARDVAALVHASESPLHELAKDALFPAPEEPDERSCCPFHSTPWFEPARCADISNEYETAQSFARAHVMPAPIVMMGEEIFLDASKLLVEGGKIHFVGDAIAPVNFAACWNWGGSPDDWIGLDTKVEVVHALVPPILWREEHGAWHLSFDFFRNAWMVKERQATIPIPKIRYPRADETGDDDTPFEERRPYSRAVSKELLDKKNVFWARKLPKLDAYEDEEEEEDDDELELEEADAS